MERITRSLTTEEALAARSWYVADAAEVSLGRLATRVASILRGKHNPAFTPHVDCGDFVVVINASKVRLTGNKADGKLYHRHSGYTGSIKTRTAGQMREEMPEELIRKAVVGMLPRGSLGRRLASKLKVYAGTEHPHTAQQPKELSL